MSLVRSTVCNYAVRLFVCKFDSLHAICNYSESAHVFRCVRLCFSRVRDVQQMHIHVQSFSCELRCVCVCVFWLFKQLLQVAVISITKSQPRVQQRVRTAWQWKLKQKTMTLFKEHLKMRQVAVNDPVNMLSRLTNIWKVLNLLCWWEKDKAAVLQSPVQLISLWKALCLSPISLSSFFQISLFVALGVRPKGKDNCWLICPSGCPSVQHFDVQNQPPNRLHWYFDSYRRNICMHLEIFQKKKILL